ncbi:MAG: hypothetical protein J5I93_05300 [Pirellulaceae bacterium]|nr:hypothetical protein [Pirellulaceae bacterium]
MSGCARADAAPDKIRAERYLVERCLAGETGAWDELYLLYHELLLAAVRLMFGPRHWDPNVVEEVAAQVWYAVVSNNAELLAQFDPDRGVRLITYLATIARSKASTMFRAEKRRRSREWQAHQARVPAASERGDFPQLQFDEFRSTLTARERDFFDSELMNTDSEQACESFTAASRWQLRSRIQNKLRRYVYGH